MRTAARQLILPVTGKWFAICAQLAGSPEQTAGDKIEVSGLQHGFVVVADGGSEDTTLFFAVFVHPDTDMLLFGRRRQI